VIEIWKLVATYYILGRNGVYHSEVEVIHIQCFEHKGSLSLSK
jgi:hypothetical protein